MPFLVGSLTPELYATSQVKHITHIRQAQELRDGDVVEFLGHALVYNSAAFVTEEACKSWRSVADPLGDDALTEVLSSSFSSTGKDLLESVQRCAHECPDSRDAAAFLKEVSRIPPPEIIATPEEIRIAQDFFFDYLPHIITGLVYFSIPSGFASPRILRTLDGISYLPRSKKDQASAEFQSRKATADSRIVSRLIESMQFFLDIMGCTEELHASSDAQRKFVDLLPGGNAWKSAVRIRLLHSVVRRRVAGYYRRKTELPSGCSEEDAPISEEDMAAALAAFSVIPLWALDRQGLHPTNEQRKAYIALWRHVGFYLGIQPDILRTYFVDLTVADQFLASMFLHVYSDSDAPDEDSGPNPTTGILSAALSSLPPFPPLSFHLGVVHHFLGSSLSQCRGIPPPSLLTKLALRVVGYTVSVPVRFGTSYPRHGWLKRQRALIREALISLIRWGLGMNHTNYFPRTGVAGQGEGRENAHKEMENTILAPVPWQHLLWVLCRLYLEMVVVISAAIVLPSLAVWFLIMQYRG